MTLRDTKLLWGNAGGICALPDCNVKLSEESSEGNKYPLGEQAHIVAEEIDGPRGKSNLSLEERNSYYNMILLCPTCHKRIDKNVEDYPIEKLHMLKTKHEEYVRNTLTAKNDRQKQAEDEFYFDITESVVTLMNLSQWNQVAFHAFNTDPSVSEYFYMGCGELYGKLKLAPWTRKKPELEASIFQVAITSRKYLSEFSDHAESDGKTWKSIRFYKIPNWDEKEYARLNRMYIEWIQNCDKLFSDVAKSLNWFSESVRKDLNPVFFHIDGRFTNPHDSLDDTMRRYDYSREEKDEIVREWMKKFS